MQPWMQSTSVWQLANMEESKQPTSSLSWVLDERHVSDSDRRYRLVKTQCDVPELLEGQVGSCLHCTRARHHKTWILSMWGASLCLPVPPCAYQVLVRVLYAALNRRDHWIRLGLYVALQSAVAGGLCWHSTSTPLQCVSHHPLCGRRYPGISFPAVLGADCYGEVVNVGDLKSHGQWLNKRVCHPRPEPSVVVQLTHRVTCCSLLIRLF